jgi:hypothetical protein
VQFLPVQWRTSLNIGDEEQREKEREGLGNTFSLAGMTYLTLPFATSSDTTDISDITLKKSIPYEIHLIF